RCRRRSSRQGALKDGSRATSRVGEIDVTRSRTGASVFPSVADNRRPINKPLMESTVNTPSATRSRSLSSATTVNPRNTRLESSAELVGRILLASLFLLSGLSKLGAYGASAAYMSSADVPGALLPAVIAVELLGSLAVIPGWKTRVAAALLPAS